MLIKISSESRSMYSSHLLLMNTVLPWLVL